MEKSKIFIISLFLIIPFFYKSQNLESYEAKNGITYKVGDTIKLNKGSGSNGEFLYFQVGGWAKGFTMASDANQFSRFGRSNSNPSKDFAGKNVFLKKIRKEGNIVTFIVSAKKGSNYNLKIDEAIESCEIEKCKSENHGSTKFDDLKKLKELKDSGVLTEEEYLKEKEKILKN